MTLPIPADHAMPESIIEQSLQVAILAYQNGMLDGAGLVRVLDAHAADPGRDIVDLIVECGHADPERIRSSLGWASSSPGVGCEYGAGVAATVDLSDPASTDRSESTRRLAPLPWAGLATEAPPSPPRTCRDPGEGASGEIRYRKEAVHAKGGLGVVFVARDRELNRKVALKEIQDEQTRRPSAKQRFVLEAEITGRLEHPGIVPVYGLGAYADGRPFYAMRFIQGESLETACKSFHNPLEPQHGPGERAVALRGLLRRFLDVCNAVDYAHSRGILHRDIKPANIMIGAYGETLVVDWGLARVMGKAAREALPDPDSVDFQSLIGYAETVEGSIVGTPGYMSPEQASGVIDDLGPESDVYSLGATLYAILTGRGPFSGIPVVPAILLKVKAGDFTPPRSVRPEVPKGLEAICLKAMSLNASDRYPTARALAEDLERWLADEPVLALPEGRVDRLARWARKHRQATVSAGLALALVAVVATSASVVVDSARRSERNQKQTAEQALKVARDANARAEAALAAESRALEAAIEARAQAEANLKKARQTVDDFLTAVSESEELRLLPDTQAFRRALLVKARDYYRDFLKGRARDAGLEREAALATDRLGQIVAEIGSLDEAARLHAEALRLLDARAAADPDDLDLKFQVARVAASVGAVQRQVGRDGEAEGLYRRSLVAFDRLLERRPEDLTISEARAKTLDRYAQLLFETGRPDFGDRYLEQSVKIREELARKSPGDPEIREGLARSLNALGNRLARTGKVDEAGNRLGRAVAVAERNAVDLPKVARHRALYATCLKDYADYLLQIGHPRESDVLFAKSLSNIEAIVRENPKVTEFQKDLVEILNAHGQARLRGGKLSDAESSYDWATDVGKELVRANPDAEEFQANLARSLGQLGQILRQSGRSAEAEHCHVDSASAYLALSRRHPGAIGHQDGYAEQLERIGDLQRAAGRTVEAERSFRKAASIRKALCNGNPKVPALRSRYGEILASLGALLTASGRPAEAEPLYRDALTHTNGATWAEPRNMRFWDALDATLVGQGETLRALGRGSEASVPSRLRGRRWVGNAAKELEIARDLALCVPHCSGGDIPRITKDAVNSLRLAVQHGWNDAPSLGHDPAFRAIRLDPGFQEILRSLQDRTFPAHPFHR